VTPQQPDFLTRRKRHWWPRQVTGGLGRSLDLARGHSRLLREQAQQPLTSPLGDLAVLLGRPAVRAAELTTVQPLRELIGQKKSLILGELGRDSGEASQVFALADKHLDVGASVADLYPVGLAAEQRDRSGDSCLDRAAAAQSSTAVVNSRYEPLLERVLDVDARGEGLAVTCAGEHLKRSLAVAIFEVLAYQAMTVDPQQALAIGTGDQRDLIERIEQTAPTARRGARRAGRMLGFVLPSGRHASMSVDATRRPPSRYVQPRPLAALNMPMPSHHPSCP
jgi:hypothetical protein